LETTPRLNNSNVFTGNQEIVGNLKADLVQVINTTPTINSHLASKLYVDTSITSRDQTLETQSDLQTADIIALEELTATHTSEIFASQVGKQNTLEAGTGIDITNNVISSTSSFVGFRADTSQNSDINVAINAVIPFNSVSVNTFTYDT
jgi:hypothetical protein